MKVLLGWELGAGQGHIQRLATLAKALQVNGCEPIFALKAYHFRNLQFPWQIIEPPALFFSGREDSYAYPDILETFGFADPILLSTHIQSWQTILQAVQPHLVIADHAPGLVLAAQGHVPTVVVGSHFAVPPPVEIFPPLRLPTPPESLERQARVGETIRKVLKIERSLGQLFNGDYSFIFSIPELDCYRFWRVNPHYVGIHITPVPSHRSQAQGAAWAYLNESHPDYNLVIRTLNAAHDFKPLPAVFRDQSLVIHHGGLTTTIGCLLSGMPQLVLPCYLEQELTALALIRLGVAQMMIRPTWDDLLMLQAQTPIIAQKAKKQAQNLTHWNQNFTNQVVEKCLQLAA